MRSKFYAPRVGPEELFFGDTKFPETMTLDYFTYIYLKNIKHFSTSSIYIFTNNSTMFKVIL